MRFSLSGPRFGSLLAGVAAAFALAACGGNAASAGGSSPTPSQVATSATPSQLATSAPSEPAGGTTSGDIPDNAVFLTYNATASAFSIPYVEGWQVSPQSAGVIIRDKDSSETVAVVDSQDDAATYLQSVDLPALQGLAGFKLIKQDTLAVGSTTYQHLAFHLTSTPDPVTGKQVPLTVDRYYIGRANKVAIVSLATPDGVDNVDAFRQMIEGFRWP
jgi:hypothetical protein